MEPPFFCRPAYVHTLFTWLTCPRVYIYRGTEKSRRNVILASCNLFLNTAIKVTSCKEEQKRMLCHMKNKKKVSSCWNMHSIQAGLAFSSVVVILMWSNLGHVTGRGLAEFDRNHLPTRCHILPGYLRSCIGTFSCSVEKGKTVTRLCITVSNRRAQAHVAQADLDRGNKSNRKLVGLMLSDNNWIG